MNDNTLIWHFFSPLDIFSFSVNGRECGYPGSPRNGSLTENPGLKYDVETQITYKCESSFVLFGQNQRTCGENGTWSGAIPECRKLIAAYFRFQSNSNRKPGLKRKKENLELA